jgi:hypothetical protein
MRVLKVALLGMFLSLMASSAEAGLQYGFWNISNNNATNVTTGKNQLKVDVSDAGSGKVKFTFTNVGTRASSITDIYFDNGGILSSLATITNQTGVLFQPGANPSTLPYASNIGFFTATNLNSESTSISFGVNQGESLGLTMNLVGGKTYFDALNALANCTLRVGVYVRGFSNGGVESFVNGSGNLQGIPIVPEPSSLALAGLAGLGMFFVRKKKPDIETPATDEATVSA